MHYFSAGYGINVDTGNKYTTTIYRLQIMRHPSYIMKELHVWLEKNSTMPSGEKQCVILQNKIQ